MLPIYGPDVLKSGHKIPVAFCDQYFCDQSANLQTDLYTNRSVHKLLITNGSQFDLPLNEVGRKLQPTRNSRHHSDGGLLRSVDHNTRDCFYIKLFFFFKCYPFSLKENRIHLIKKMKSVILIF